MTSHTQHLEASHEMKMASVVAKMDQGKGTQAEEDTPMYTTNLSKVMRISFIAAASRKGRNIKQIVNFSRKRDLEASMETIDTTSETASMSKLIAS